MSATYSLEQNLSELKRLGRFPARQTLHGFEPQYQNIVDYIVKITYRIWEEADMGYIRETYKADLKVHTGYGTAQGVEEVVSGSVAFLAAMPDRRMVAEDVIWSGDNDAGFHTSHLIMNTASNTGYSPWGAPTGKPAEFWAIANCLVKENRIVEEWLVRDSMALVRQLGFDPWDIARAAGAKLPSFNTVPDLPNVMSPAETMVCNMFDAVFNGRHFNHLAEVYAEGSSLHLPGHQEISSLIGIRNYHLGLMAQFPDASMTLEHIYSLENEADGARVAVRWCLKGTHAVNGFYGLASQRPVTILGLSQVHVKDNKISRHYMLFDELAVLMQLVDS